MHRILILDTETSGPDASKDAIVELAFIVYDVRHASVVECFASILESKSNDAEAINGIPAAMLMDPINHGRRSFALNTLCDRAIGCDAVVAYNEIFDRAFVEIALGEQVKPIGLPMPWICAMSDIEWPRAPGRRVPLTSLLLSHGLGVSHAHRALADCEMIARLLTRSAELGADLAAMLTRAARPKVRVVARVSYDEKDKAKERGFMWDDQRREWWRVMFRDDVEGLPFRVAITDLPPPVCVPAPAVQQ